MSDRSTTEALRRPGRAPDRRWRDRNRSALLVHD